MAGGPKGVEYLTKQPVDAVITSFMGLSEEGFRTAKDYEVGEKLMNLRPHKACRTVLIPMGWAKIGSTGGHLVAEGGKVKGGLDFLKGERTYVILTDAPRGEVSEGDRRRFEILEYWRAMDGVEVVEVCEA